jgi:hypothetical protein
MARLVQSASSRKPAGPVIPQRLRECIVEDWAPDPVPPAYGREGDDWPPVMRQMLTAWHLWRRARMDWARARPEPIADALRLLPRPERTGPRFRNAPTPKPRPSEQRTEPRRGWRG